MRLVLRESSRNVTLTTSGTATDVYIAIYHEWGDVVKESTLVSAGPASSFTYTLTSTDTASAGVHKIVWTYTQASVSFTTTEYIRIYNPYTTSSVFFQAYPELDCPDNYDAFDAVERAVRKTIDQYCQQEFQCINSKTLKLDGTGTSTLPLNVRTFDLTGVWLNGEEADDLIDFIEINPESKFYLRWKRIFNDSDPTVDYIGSRTFSRKSVYWVKSSFGWPYVPQDIEDAANILIAESMNQDSAYRKHNISFQGTGPIQTRLNPDLFGTTGNMDADILLMDYSRLTLEYV